jgi:hypothetical protein
MLVPEIPLVSERLVSFESPVTVHELVASSIRAAELMKPERVEPFCRVAAIELMLSVTRLPVRVSPSAVNCTVPPFFTGRIISLFALWWYDACPV